jgi:sugar (pentulose or hexulose) kinase
VTGPVVAVLDVGKSNAKAALVEPAGRGVLAIRTTPNDVLTDGPYPHFDVERLWRWFLGETKGFAEQAAVDTVAATTHGACFALVAADDLALPILDYEYKGPEALNSGYRAVRGNFAELLSPDLPGGLNAGRQFFWLERSFPEAFAKADAILPYPQYWTWRASGAKTADATSFGAHTDLWNPRAGRFSRLAEDQGWAALVPHLIKPWDVVGNVLPEVARQAGLAPTVRVVAGIHDSNATLLPHILWREPPFAVLSTGTWMITFAVGGSLDALDPARDCLANVDAFARAVPSAMAMVGREFDLLVAGATAEPTNDDVASVVAGDVMAQPAFVAGSGPFGARKGEWTAAPDSLSPGNRVAAASLYAALIAETCLKLAGAAGPVIVEGPFARNRVFLEALAQLVGRPVIAPPHPTGTTEGAALLALGPDAARPTAADPPAVKPLAVSLSGYAERWRRRAGAL